jgi:hypothetical protein
VVEAPGPSWSRRFGSWCWPPTWWGGAPADLDQDPPGARCPVYRGAGRVGGWVGGWFAAPAPLAGPLALHLPEPCQLRRGNSKLSGAGAFAGVSGAARWVRGRGVPRVGGGGRAA